MSDTLKKIKDKTDEEIKIFQMENIIHKDRIIKQYDDLKSKKELEKITSEVNLTLGNKKKLERIQSENDTYFKSLEEISCFINDDFKQVPFFPGTITMVLAVTGQGKSTTSANLAYHMLTQGKKVLVISNEEKIIDIYNRVTCLIKGWNYQQHDKFTKDEQQVFRKYIEILGSRMTVIDNLDENGEKNVSQTTSVEGMENVFQKIIEGKNKGNKFDIIIIDYYQNVFESLKNTRASTWENQEKFGKLLDQLKNSCGAPIVLMAQKKPGKEEGMGDWKNLIEGRKSISNVVTCALEIKADIENYRTEWIIHKNRWGSAANESIYTGYDRGKYVYYNDEFIKKINSHKQSIEQAELLAHRRRQLEDKE